MKKQTGSPPPVLLRLRNLIAALNRTLLSINLTDLPSRVRELPDERTARFYTTLGLISPPARFDGRRALYGRRHLLQLLAIKRLQSQGMAIRDIQEKIKNAGTEKLLAIANVDPEIVQKAIEDSAKDTSIDLWPRPAGEPPLVQPPVERPASSLAAGVDPARPGSARCYRIADGIYFTIDPDLSAKIPPNEIRQRIRAFADQFPSGGPPP